MKVVDVISIEDVLIFFKDAKKKILAFNAWTSVIVYRMEIVILHLALVNVIGNILVPNVTIVSV